MIDCLNSSDVFLIYKSAYIYYLQLTKKLLIIDFFINIICGGLVAISSIVCLHFGIIKDLDKLIAGSIMLLVPGLALTNSIRDLLEGQLVSGLTRAAEAFFVGLSAAIGTGSILHIYLRLGGF